MGIGFVELMPQYMGSQLMPIQFSIFDSFVLKKQLLIFERGEDNGKRAGNS
jgi:hypothetical protein